MEQISSGEDFNVTLIRARDYHLVRELGQGACGKTVLLHDTLIDEYFVCKKYQPCSESLRNELFEAFVREIKLLHQVHHENVVRIFSHFLYPARCAGYILMEYIQGEEIADYIKKHPASIDSVFQQAIDGFEYLEGRGILHRDLRPANLMVTTEGRVKIIDLGFGKKVAKPDDFQKSISLNWWCDTPEDFDRSVYDYRTEVYFVGKLFERLITDNELAHFKHMDVLRRMCCRSPDDRIASFANVRQNLGVNQFSEASFTQEQLNAYRAFADAIARHITKIENNARYIQDIDEVLTKLGETYRRVMLEEEMPDCGVVLKCLMEGVWYYRKAGFRVHHVREFIRLLQGANTEKRRVIMANLHNRIDSIPRYHREFDDIPF